MKLRELNSLINNSEQINRKIVFIYAIKDDLFMNKDRTKFFDYIIPVIPIINSSNSGEIFWKELESHNLSDDLSKHFISDICLFINDMRILNNIFNEYITYKSKLLSDEDSFLVPQRMLAMIVYKNIFPNDFSQLQFDKGYIFEIFQKKGKVIKEYVSSLKEEYLALEKMITRANHELLQKEKELKTIYWNEATNYSGNINFVKINGNFRTLPEVLQDDFDITAIEGTVLCRYHNGNTVQFVLDGERRKELIKRIDDVRNKSNDKQTEVHKKMEDIKKQIGNLELWSLKEVIESVGIERFIPKSTEENKLIRFLLRNGYIDEMYPNYINYFYSGSLTHHDMVFIMKIKDQVGLEYSHHLIKIRKVIEKLNILEFERKEILNYDLVNYLIDNSTEYCRCSPSLTATCPTSMSVSFAHNPCQRGMPLIPNRDFCYQLNSSSTISLTI